MPDERVVSNDNFRQLVDNKFEIPSNRFGFCGYVRSQFGSPRICMQATDMLAIFNYGMDSNLKTTYFGQDLQDLTGFYLIIFGFRLPA